MDVRSWEFPAMAECVSGARRAVTAFADGHDVPEPPLEDLRLALSEAVTNAVVHGYRVRAPGTITIVVAIDPASVVVSVTDDGDGMTPRVDSPGLGLGMPLMSTLADSIEVGSAPDGHGTAVRMQFSLAG